MHQSNPLDGKAASCRRTPKYIIVFLKRRTKE
jgi:hypothetical protein